VADVLDVVSAAAAGASFDVELGAFSVSTLVDITVISVCAAGVSITVTGASILIGLIGLAGLIGLDTFAGFIGLSVQLFDVSTQSSQTGCT